MFVQCLTFAQRTDYFLQFLRSIWQQRSSYFDVNNELHRVHCQLKLQCEDGSHFVGVKVLIFNSIIFCLFLRQCFLVNKIVKLVMKLILMGNGVDNFLKFVSLLFKSHQSTDTAYHPHLCFLFKVNFIILNQCSFLSMHNLLRCILEEICIFHSLFLLCPLFLVKSHLFRWLMHFHKFFAVSNDQYFGLISFGVNWFVSCWVHSLSKSDRLRFFL